MDRSSSHDYFSKNHEDINLTKEEMEFLEQQFLKYLTSEMERDSSTWKDFYDILQEEQKKGAYGKPTPATSDQRRSQNYANEQPTSKDSGFKVNTERTKQQYKHDAAPPNMNSKWGSSQKQQRQQQQQQQQQQTKNPFSNRGSSYMDSNSNNSYDTSSKQNKSKTQSKKSKNTAKTSSTRTKQKQTSQHSQPPTANDGLSSSKKNMMAQELVSKNTAASIFNIVKNVFIMFICFALMILALVFRIFWIVSTSLLKYGIIAVIYVAKRIMKYASRLNQRFLLLENFCHYGRNGVELFILLTGIDVWHLLTRWKKKRTSVDDVDNTPVVLPENAEEAIKQLLNQKDSRQPYRILCVNRNATHEEIKANYRKMARLVHPDKCEIKDADEAFKVLDTAFKKISDPEKRGEVDEEIEKERAWKEFNKNMGEEYKKMFDDLVNSISCGSCNKRHKKNLVKERTFYEARYCGDCDVRHSANDGDVWVEESMLGLNWTCYACFDGEVFEITEWGKCQNLKGRVPANNHKVTCRLGSSKDNNSNVPGKKKSKKSRKQRK